MKINEQALKAVKAIKIDGEKLVELLEKLADDFEPEMNKIEFSLGFYEDDAAPIGALLPEIILQLKVKK